MDKIKESQISFSETQQVSHWWLDGVRMEEVWNHIEVVQSRHPAVEKVRCQLFAMLHWRQKTRELGTERRLENFSAEPFQSLDRESNSYLSSTACSEIQQLIFSGNFRFFFICLRWFGWMDGSYWKWPKVLSGDSWKELEAIFQELESLPIIAHHSNRSQCVFHTTIKHSEFCFRTNTVRNQINQEYW